MVVDSVPLTPLLCFFVVNNSEDAFDYSFNVHCLGFNGKSELRMLEPMQGWPVYAENSIHNKFYAELIPAHIVALQPLAPMKKVAGNVLFSINLSSHLKVFPQFLAGWSAALWWAPLRHIQVGGKSRAWGEKENSWNTGKKTLLIKWEINF